MNSIPPELQQLINIALSDVNNTRIPIDDLIQQSYDEYMDSSVVQNPATQEDINTQTQFIELDQIVKCSICLEDIPEGKFVCELIQCKHQFHHGCIYEWFKKL